MILAQLTAVEVLILVLVVGCISALFGWAGGAGALLRVSMRLHTVEGITFTLLNRLKGAKGGEAAQVQRGRASSAEKEAEMLAAKLEAARSRSPRSRFAWPLRRPLSPIDAAEEQSFAEIEAQQEGLRKSEQIAKSFLDGTKKDGAA